MRSRDAGPTVREGILSARCGAPSPTVGPATFLRWGAACLILCLIAPVASAQQQLTAERKKQLLEGTHVFRRILFDHDCTPLKTFGELKGASPDNTILIILGDLNTWIPQVPGGLRNFVERGGAVLLASDRPLSDADGVQAQVRVLTGASIREDEGDNFNHGSCYKGLSYCPYIKPVPSASPDLFTDTGGAPILTVAANVPSHLNIRKLPSGMATLARLPDRNQHDFPRRGNPFQQDSSLPFIVGGERGERGKGRVLLIADHSVFINEMMLPEDTGNVEFAGNCVRWLRGPTQRKQVLFIDEGGIQTKFDFPVKPVQIPFEELVELAFANRNRLIKFGENELLRLEQRNAFNQAAGRGLQWLDRPEGMLLVAIAVASTLLLIFYGVYRLGIRDRFGYDRRTPPLAPLVDQNLPIGPLVEQRNQALLRMGNVNEPAGRMARRWFATHGVHGHDWDPAGLPVEIKGGWWAAGKLRRRLLRLWLLACGRSAEKIDPANLWRLQREFESLAEARQRGQWGPAAGSSEKKGERAERGVVA